MLHISDHYFLWQQNLRSWACVPANISETHLPRTITCKEQNFLTVAALLESAILSGEITPRISADNERSRPFQQVLSARILSCGLASINHPVLVMSSTRGPSLASKEIDRKNDCKREITCARQVPTIEYTLHCIEHDRKFGQVIS